VTRRQTGRLTVGRKINFELRIWCQFHRTECTVATVTVTSRKKSKISFAEAKLSSSVREGRTGPTSCVNAEGRQGWGGSAVVRKKSVTFRVGMHNTATISGRRVPRIRQHSQSFRAA
jgi:hypothetical protein